MEAKEFMIGNLIYDKLGNICAICSINKTFYHLDGYSRQVAYRTIRPIPLTEEILLSIKNITVESFGLRKIYKLGTGNLKFELNGGEIAVYFMENLLCFKKYVHQLQNMLYVNWELKIEINL